MFFSFVYYEDDDSTVKEDMKTSELNPTERYYVHIDVLRETGVKDKRPDVSRKINEHMKSQQSCDPLRRKQVGTHYEFWKVLRNFSLEKFENMVDNLPTARGVRIVRIINNQHDKHIYRSLLLKIEEHKKKINTISQGLEGWSNILMLAN